MMRKTFAIAAVAVLIFLGGLSRSADSKTEISGRKTIAISGSIGLPGVTLQGLPGLPATDENGVYAATVESGWSGRVTPIKVGYRFQPSSRTYSAVSKSLTGEDYKAMLLTFTISGNAGASRVTMAGLPGDPVSNVSGDYSVHVAYGWSGTVTPVREGLAFSPRAKTYQQVTADHTNQNYTTKAATFTISGNVGVPGVALRGLPGGPVSGTGGFYAGKVPYGWTGTVMPVKEGCTFVPPRRIYEKIASDQTNQEYVSNVVPYTIAGNAGLSGVTMEGLPGDPISDDNGYYSATVESGWTGTVTPKKGDRKFNPASKRYAAVARDLTDEDYIPLTVVISDRIVFGTEPIADVTITADPGGYTATTDRQGCYRVEVPYGWSGMLLMSKPGFEFSPPGISFTRVTADIDKTAPSGAPFRAVSAPTGRGLPLSFNDPAG